MSRFSLPTSWALARSSRSAATIAHQIATRAELLLRADEPRSAIVLEIRRIADIHELVATEFEQEAANAQEEAARRLNDLDPGSSAPNADTQ